MQISNTEIKEVFSIATPYALAIISKLRQCIKIPNINLPQLFVPGAHSQLEEGVNESITLHRSVIRPIHLLSWNLLAEVQI